MGAQKDSPPLRIDVSPTVGIEPLDVRVTVRIVKDSDNRAFCLNIWGDTGFYQSSCRDHVGKPAPSQIIFSFLQLPAGEYIVTAVLQKTTGKLQVSRNVSVK